MTALTVSVTPTIATSIADWVTANTYHTITRLATEVADLEVRVIAKYFWKFLFRRIPDVLLFISMPQWCYKVRF
jgi:hypothetical protein